jgi:hypothetical protein
MKFLPSQIFVKRKEAAMGAALKNWLWFAGIAVLAALLLAAFCGVLNTTSKAEYVRKNRCVLTSDSPDSKLFLHGRVHEEPGWKTYACPDNVFVVIENDEEQP